MELYTKNGEPSQVINEIVYSKRGVVVGKIRENKVLGPNGKYVGTIVGDRLVFRSTESNLIGPAFCVANICGTARANRIPSAIWGDEPDIPE